MALEPRMMFDAAGVVTAAKQAEAIVPAADHAPVEAAAQATPPAPR